MKRSFLRGSVPLFAPCLLLIGSAGVVRALEGTPSPTPSEALDREVKAARSYLEGWFGTPMVVPPIEIVAGPAPDGSADLPGHYQDGVVRMRP